MFFFSSLKLTKDRSSHPDMKQVNMIEQEIDHEKLKKYTPYKQKQKKKYARSV